MQLSQFIQKHRINYQVIWLLSAMTLGLLWTQVQADPTATDCAAQTDIPQAECDTLIAFYNSTDGPNWTNHADWNVTNTPCSWYGVTCNGSRVQQLLLDNNQLSGSIPDLSALTSLQWLLLGYNQLSGSIPNLSALTSLQGLNLHDNQLSGSIPDLSALTNLRDLWLHDNQLSGAIPDLSTLSNLESLHLGSNQLSGSIPDLSALTSLLGLDLQDNQLSGPIPDLSTLISLQQLNLYNNQLSSSIPDLSALTNLQQLRLENNQLSGSVPASVCQVLSHVNIGYNKLEVDTAVPCVDTVDPDWKDTQTVPPTNVRAVPVSATEVKLTWNAIIYTQDGGNYSVWGKEQHDPTYTLMVTTTNKTITGTVVVGLQPGTTYDFVIRTFTPAHGDQQNDLTSVDSGRVTAVTTRFFAVYLPTISNPYSFEAVTINETQIPGRPIIVMGEVFYTTTANIGANLPPDGTFYLSSSTNTPVAAAVDDEVVILLNGTELFSFTYGQLGSGVTPALVEVPRSVMQQIAGETVTIEFRDVYGVIVAATVMYLIWSP